MRMCIKDKGYGHVRTLVFRQKKSPQAFRLEGTGGIRVLLGLLVLLGYCFLVTLEHHCQAIDCIGIALLGSTIECACNNHELLFQCQSCDWVVWTNFCPLFHCYLPVKVLGSVLDIDKHTIL